MAGGGQGDQVRRQGVERLVRLRGRVDLVPLPLQQVTQQVELKWALVDGEDGWHGWPR
jgi:hypothetical protein